jgi:hypothetical protein
MKQNKGKTKNQGASKSRGKKNVADLPGRKLSIVQVDAVRGGTGTRLTDKVP